MDKELKVKAVIKSITGIFGIAFSMFKMENVIVCLKRTLNSLIHFLLCNIVTFVSIGVISFVRPLNDFYIFFIVVGSLIFLFVFDVMIEFFVLLKRTRDDYERLLDRQKRLHNIGLILVSLFALWISAFLKDSLAMISNVGLLAIGFLLLFATVSTDIYELCIHKKGYVSDLVYQVKGLWNGNLGIEEEEKR